MLDNPDDYGIYPTTKAYDELEKYISGVRTEIELELDEEAVIKIIGDWVNDVNTDVGARGEWRLLAKTINANLPEIIKLKK